MKKTKKASKSLIKIKGRHEKKPSSRWNKYSNSTWNYIRLVAYNEEDFNPIYLGTKNIRSDKA
jgi:hypothetical protein